jgi:hypothetical protein
MSFLFYYLTEDSENLKERNEVNYLRSIGRVVVVTRGGASAVSQHQKIKNLNLPAQSRAVVTAYSLWTKICYLLARSSNSLTDIGFKLRNVYTGHAILRWFINRLWPVKYIGVVNRLLPSYEQLYFAPFMLVSFFLRHKRRSCKRFRRIVVHDSLILRLTRFTPFILAARRSGWRTVANVKSWDNPFYSQFVCKADGYLTWSQSMWRDVQRFHSPDTTAYHIWGPRPFYNFASAVQRSGLSPDSSAGPLVLGYAAAFCDSLMAAHEVEVVASLAEDLLVSGVDAKILFRPYPIVMMSSYEPLLRYPNIEIVDIQGLSTDRYGDGREIIRFGSDEERIQYLSRCHCFLSIATSFTFEAALFGLPVLQYFVPKASRKTKSESILFERLDISDHILNYFIPYLPVAKNSAEMVGLIRAFKTTPVLRQPPLEMMSVVGFPSKLDSWNERLGKFITDMHLV